MKLAKLFSVCGRITSSQSLDEETLTGRARRRRRSRRLPGEPDMTPQPGEIQSLQSNYRDRTTELPPKTANSRSNFSASGPPFPPRERLRVCESCSSRLDREKQLQDEVQALKQNNEALKGRIEHTEDKLGKERSLSDNWTTEYRAREESMRTKISELQSKNEALHRKLYKGRRDFVTRDEVRDCLNTWHAKAGTFCPKYFPYDASADTQALSMLLENGGDSIFSHELFYYEKQAELFESILNRTSEMFLAMAQRSLDKQRYELDQIVGKEQVELPLSLPMWPIFAASFSEDDDLELLREKFASILHNDGISRERMLAGFPTPLRSSLVSTLAQVHQDMEQYRYLSGGKGRDDSEVRRQLDLLVFLLVGLLLNTEASSACFRFVRVDADESFNEDYMEAIGVATDMNGNWNNPTQVQLAVTRALMECDDNGLPRSCVAKAWVIVRSAGGGFG